MGKSRGKDEFKLLKHLSYQGFALYYQETNLLVNRITLLLIVLRYDCVLYNSFYLEM